MKYVFIFFAICVLLQPISQILERKGMSQIGKLESFHDIFQVNTIVKLITNPYVVAGVLLSSIALIFWLATMSNWEVSYLYPFGGGLMQIILVFFAFLFLGEDITAGRWLGVGVITIGIVILNWWGA